MTFKSSGVKFAGDNPAEISGNLTLLGITKPVSMKVERWVCKDHPMNKKPICGGNATGTLKRSGAQAKSPCRNQFPSRSR